MKYCGQCGTPNEDKSRFCTSCGAPLEANTDNSGNFGADEAKEADMEKEEIIYTNVAPRSIVLSIVLSIVTCGIYGLYWMYELNNEVNELAQDPAGSYGDKLGTGAPVYFSHMWYLWNILVLQNGSEMR